MQGYRSRVKTRRSSGNSRGNKRVMICFFLALLFLLFLWDVAGPYGIWKLHRVREQRKILYAQVIEADRENAMLKKKVDDFKKDRHLQEQEVRKRLGWIKKNEMVYRFVD